MINREKVVEIIKAICDLDGDLTDFKGKRNDRKRAEKDEEESLQNLNEANQKMQDLYFELMKEVEDKK